MKGLRRFMLELSVVHQCVLELHHIGVSHFPCLSIFPEVLLVLFLPQKQA